MTENQPKPLMIMFTIGPAQPFIEAARKTEDLWMGSYILSYLVATAMEKVQLSGVELIYPAIGSESPFKFWRKQDFATPSFPNLFLGVGDGALSQDDLAKHAKAAEITVSSVFKQMAGRVLDKAFGKNWRNRDTYLKEVFNRQISDFFDVYWVITEQEPEQSYGDWYEYTASSLAAIKNCRAFKQTHELGRKCSLDGTREILHLEKEESVEQAMRWWEDFAKRTPRHCRQKEALCAVSLTKRMGRHYLENHSEFSADFTSDRPRFPSTSEVATAVFKERLQCNIPALELYKVFCQEVKKLKASNDTDAAIPIVQPLPKIKCPIPNNVDGEWLYEETWNPAYLERYYNIDWTGAKDQIEHCKSLRSQLVQLLKGEPGKYYAAIALDADNMGEVNRKAENREEHEANSQQLIEYTKDARRIVEEEYLGKLTYAGGDDLLALVNLKDLLPILKKLRKKFPKFTSASAGVCIAHNKMPLGDVLRHARRMEKAAKNIDKGKNAIGIALFKRSGNISEIVTKGEYGDLDVLVVSEKLVTLLQDGEVSKRFLYDFREIFAKLIEDTDDYISLGRELIQTEFRRIMDRAHSGMGTQVEMTQQTIDTIDALTQLMYRIHPFSNFLGYLEITNFIARG